MRVHKTYSNNLEKIAIIANESKFVVENLTQTEIEIPWGIEVVWAVLTPKILTNDSKIKKIIVGSIYSKPDSRKKSVLLDHIAQVYNLLSSKFKEGLHWLLCGDTNDLKLDEILSLNSNLKQVVQTPTRLNPPRILDPIITSMSDYYQLPVCLPPLDADPDSNGKPSDHLMVVMSPVSVLNNKSARTKKKIVYRPYSELRLQEMKEWIENENWNSILEECTADKKMELLQNLLVSKYQKFFPEKCRNINSDTDPFFSEKLEKMRRRKSREYKKHRRSEKWKILQTKYSDELKKTKANFYRRRMSKLRGKNPKKWYSELKKLTRYNQHQDEEIIVESIKEFSDEEQAELIANTFAEVSQEYDKLKRDDIDIPEFDESDIPYITETDVRKTLDEIDTNKSNVDGDVPSKILKQFSSYLALPFANVLNSAIRQGCWPTILKLEMVTPVAKVNPPQNLDQLRNISGLLNFDKIAEKILSKLIIGDMKSKLDPAQYANQKGLSIQHYLVKMIDRILQAVETGSKSESVAVLATLVDWKQAFPRQCPKLGINSFIQNGVRPSLIPIMISYFQDRCMKVKWHGKVSSSKELNGGGPQGSTFGIWEYLSQSNHNADNISESDRFKFVDDLSFLEIIQLLSAGIATYNIRSHVPNNIPSHN